MDHGKEILTRMHRALVLLVIVGLLTGASSAFASTSKTGTLSAFLRTDSNYINEYFGQSSGVDVLAWFYMPNYDESVCTVSIPLRSQGSPTDSVQLQFYYQKNYVASSTINFTTPTTAPLSGLTPDNSIYLQSADASWQVRNTGNFIEYDYTFTPCLLLSKSYGYFFKLSRTLTASNSNNYIAGSYVDGSGSSYSFSGNDNTNNWMYYHSVNGTWVIPGGHTMTQIVLSGNSDLGYPVSPPVTFGPSVMNALTALNDTNATTTASANVSKWVNIPGYFANKVPWGYIFSIRDAYKNAATSTGDPGTIYLDFNDTRISTGTRSYLPGKIAVFSTSTIGYYFNGIALDGANTLLAAAGWIMALTYWYRRAVAV